MRKLLILILFWIFIIHRDIVINSSLNALYIWTYKLFPLLFPTFILSDLLLSSNLINFLVSKFGKLYRRIFNNNENCLYIFLISLLSGTPNNVKNMMILKSKGILNDGEINKVLISSLMFNPFLIISVGGIKLFIILIISNIITGILFRNVKLNINFSNIDFKYNFDITESISKNIDIIFNILGTVVIYSVLIGILCTNNTYIDFGINALFELSNALEYNYLMFDSNIVLNSIIFSFGGISIFTQIKSILKDTFINYKLLIFSRLVCTCVSVLICSFT